MSRLAKVMMLLSLGVNIGVGAAWAEKWIEHRPPGEGYRVDLPGASDAIADNVPTDAGTIRYHAARVESGALVFVATRMDYPAAALPGDPQTALDGVRAGQLQYGGVLRNERHLTVGGAPARRFVFDRDGQVVSSLAVLQGDVLYQMVCTGPRGSEVSADVERFLSSFQLVSH